MAGLSLKASQQNLYQLFKTSERYIIPEFQRPYSWGRHTGETDAIVLSKGITPVYIDGMKNYN